MNLDSGERLASMARVADRDEDVPSPEGATESEPPKGNGAATGSNGAEPGETDGGEGS
jgi:hypothetical protein